MCEVSSGYTYKRTFQAIYAVQAIRCGAIGVARGGQRGHAPAKLLENIVILCFERHFSKQNSVIRLKLNILAPPKFLPLPNFWAGYDTVWCQQHWFWTHANKMLAQRRLQPKVTKVFDKSFGVQTHKISVRWFRNWNHNLVIKYCIFLN